jgi:tetratricopeptide (TPR) repeat protein
VLPFRGKTGIRPDSVGRQLNVGGLVVGSIEPTSRGVRVEVRYVDAASGTRFDAKSFDFDTANVLALQDTIATEVAQFLRNRVGDEVRLRERRRSTTNSDAWLLLQRAERGAKDADSLVVAGQVEPALSVLARADSQLAQAEAADPSWAAVPTARSSVAYMKAYALRGQPLRAAPIVDTGIVYADRALSIDARSADALEYKGKLLSFQISQNLITDPSEHARTLVVAESTLTRAVAINSDQAGAWEALGAVYNRKPDLQAAIRAYYTAYEKDAYLRSTRSILTRLFYASYSLELYPDAMRWLNEFKRRYPNDQYAIEARQLMYWAKGQRPDLDSALINLEAYVQRSPVAGQAFARRKAEMHYAGALARAGLADSARSVLLRARAPSNEADPTRYLSATEAAVRTMLGDHDIAVSRIQDYLTVNPTHRRGFANHTMWWWRDLQTNPRFKALVASQQ